MGSTSSPIAQLESQQRSGSLQQRIIARRPDIIIGSGAARNSAPRSSPLDSVFEQIPAVRNRTLYEMKSPIILQPGPAALTDGLKALQAIIERAGQAITAT